MRNASGAIFLQKSLELVADCMPALLTASERQTLGLFSSSQELVHREPHQRRDWSQGFLRERVQRFPLLLGQPNHSSLHGPIVPYRCLGRDGQFVLE
jgi:hypothetical protein